MSASKVLLGIVAGVAVGAALGVLFAPDSGANTRQKISKQSRDYVDQFKSKMSDMVDGLMSQVESTKHEMESKAKDFANRAKSKVNEMTQDHKRSAEV